MKKISLALLTAAAVLLASTAGLACDKDHAKTADGAKHACCAKAKTAEGKASCSKAKATTAEGKAHCSKAKATTAEGKPSCSKAKAMTAEGKKACPMAAKNAQQVAMTGRVLCEHCNLHKTETCNPVFQADGQEGYIALCPKGDVDGAKTASDHGTKVLDVKGTMCVEEDGSKALMIDSYVVKA